MGNKYKYAPLLGIISQILWVWYVITIQQWGLLIGEVGFLVVYVRDCIKWRKDEK
jgi:hypothetical protein